MRRMEASQLSQGTSNIWMCWNEFHDFHLTSSWGYTTNPGHAASNLQWIRVKTIGNEECRKKMTKTNAAKIFDTTICAEAQDPGGACKWWRRSNILSQFAYFDCFRHGWLRRAYGEQWCHRWHRFLGRSLLNGIPRRLHSFRFLSLVDRQCCRLLIIKREDTNKSFLIAYASLTPWNYAFGNMMLRWKS